MIKVINFMRKTVIALIILIFLFCFSGCGENKSDLPIEQETKDFCQEKINEILKKEHWNYDDNISYERDDIPDEKSAAFEQIKNICFSYGFDIDEFKGRQAVRASVKLFYLNSEEAGIASFYFIDDDMICGYYSMGEDVYPFSEMNVFLNDGFSEKTENLEKIQKFKEISVQKKFDKFDDGFWNGNNSVVGVISEDKLNFFKFNAEGFYLDRELDFSKENLFPMDVSFNDDGKIAVLLGQKKKPEHDVIYSEEVIEEMKRNGLTDKEIYGAEILISDRIVFLDENYNNIFSPCKLEVSSYGSVDFTDGKVFASRGRGIDVFSNQNGVFSKTKQYLFKQRAEKIKSADIDGDGTKEFVMTDKTNLFIYHLGDVPVLLWKTHLSLESMEENFYIEDLNGDGIKEIYVSDNYLNTSAKYVLMDYGFKALSAEYGVEYIPCDLNGDGKMDYIAIGNDDGSYKIFIAE